MVEIKNTKQISKMITCECGKLLKCCSSTHDNSYEHKIRLLCPNGFIFQKFEKSYYVNLKDLPIDELQTFIDRDIKVVMYDDFKRWKNDKNIDNILVEGDGIHYKYPKPYYRANANRKWEAYPRVKGKRINIGNFDTKEECELAIKKTFDELWTKQVMEELSE